MRIFIYFLFSLSFNVIFSNNANGLNELDRLEEIEYRLHNNARDEVVYIDASSFTDWTYFSFETNSIVEVPNPESSLNWDLAFKRNHIKTNSGLSGQGLGGGYVDSTQSWLDAWQTINTIPENAVWEVDESMCCYYDIITHEFNLEIIKNPALNNWGDFNSNQQFLYTNYVMFIKNADGDIAKFWPYDYYATGA